MAAELTQRAQPPRPTFRPALLALVLAALAVGCAPPPPADPAARLEWARHRIETARTGHLAAGWLVHIINDVNPATREYLVTLLRGPRTELAKELILLLDREPWLQDAAMRAALCEFVLDSNQSMQRRGRLLNQLINKHRDRFPEFAALPAEPPRRTGMAFVREAAP